MQNSTLAVILVSLLTLSGCSDAPSSPETQAVPSEKAAEKISADLAKMDTPELIEFVDTEAKDLTALLETVTDGASAEAAVEDIRTRVPRINASLRSLENLDVENMSLNIGNMRKMMKVAQSQVGLVNEVIRISEIPEARAVLQKEFDKIEITHK